METIQILANIILGLIIFYLGILEKRLSDMQTKLDVKVSRKEMERTVDLEIQTVRNEQSNLKEDINRVEHKVDKILDKLTGIK